VSRAFLCIAALGIAACFLEFDRSRIAPACDGCVTDCEGVSDQTPCASGAATGLCYADACCTGCWDGAACLAGDVVAACGARGSACSMCPAVQACSVGTCRLERALVALSLGSEVSCAVDALGDMWCWGNSQSGQLGIAGLEETLTPRKLTIGAGVWMNVTVGDVIGHACGLQKDGSAWCWGSNGNGELGLGTLDIPSMPEPTAVTPGAPPWSALRVGAPFTCGLRENSTLWCWGWKYVGFVHSDSYVLAPTQVGVDTDWQQLSLGQHHACALKSDESVWCWGESPAPQLEPPKLVDTSYKAIAAGWAHTCGVRVDGSLWCWGDNTSGQLGLGTSGGAITEPTQVGTGTSWVAVSAGGAHTCAIDAANTLYCWGDNLAMQLGHGMTSEPAFNPTPVASEDRFELVDLGFEHSCAARVDGALVCWGQGGRIGLDHVTAIGVPTPIPLVEP
jgi:alpha-tubulin suppressor-like RCC1 family protein